MANSSVLDNAIRNTLRSITKGNTLPEKKAIKELFLALMREGTTIVNHLADTKKKTKVSKQSERFRRHLEQIDIVAPIEEKIRRILPNIETDTVIAYDLSDIAKPHAKKIEGLSKVFDGSERRPSNGYTFHGVSIGHQPMTMQIHDSNAKTLNQTRLEVIEKVQKRTGKSGIWVFDRGNDDQQFFTALTEAKLRFVIRLRSNRNFITRETGEVLSCEAFKSGVYLGSVAKKQRRIHAGSTKISSGHEANTSAHKCFRENSRGDY